MSLQFWHSVEIMWGDNVAAVVTKFIRAIHWVCNNMDCSGVCVSNNWLQQLFVPIPPGGFWLEMVKKICIVKNWCPHPNPFYLAANQHTKKQQLHGAIFIPVETRPISFVQMYNILLSIVLCAVGLVGAAALFAQAALRHSVRHRSRLDTAE